MTASTHTPAPPRDHAPAPPRARAGLGAIALIVRRSLRQHALSTTITIFAVALACGLTMSVFAIRDQAWQAFQGGAGGFDAVLGARGSKLQLVLNSVYHLEASPGNIPWSLYEEMHDHPGVALAVPYAVGDNYYGVRIVGTSEDLFTEFEPRPDAEARGLRIQAGGRLFDPELREAVVGSEAARRTGLVFGAVFEPHHGTEFNEHEKHDEEYVVVGILEPTNTPIDRVIFIPIEGILRMSGHILRHEDDIHIAEPGEEIPDEFMQISAVMLKLKSPQVGLDFDEQFNKQDSGATFAWPIGTIMADLFDKFGWLIRVLTLVAYLVVIISACAILAALYNTINERRREFAILRAIGARRMTVFSAVTVESSVIAGAGALAGFVVYGLVLAAAAAIIRRQTGVVLDAWTLHPVHAWAPAGMILLGAVAGLLPAAKAYATDVAENLAPQT